MNQNIKSPFDIVAQVLGINKGLLTEHSGIGETPNWDSLKQLDIIGELESNYGIQIPDEDIEKYTEMNAIIELYENVKAK